jgi:hypothetical protein
MNICCKLLHAITQLLATFSHAIVTNRAARIMQGLGVGVAATSPDRKLHTAVCTVTPN